MMSVATVVTDGVLIDVSDLCLDDLLADIDGDVLTTALNRVIATPSDCANSFQSTI
jgi:hypothetical protein